MTNRSQFYGNFELDDLEGWATVEEKVVRKQTAEEKSIRKQTAISIEDQFFIWDKVDKIGNVVYMFYDVELITSVGKFHIGRKFRDAIVDYERSTMTFREKDDSEYSFHMSVSLSSI
jgi:hypothetical protein